jgi:hypothetical protein
MRRLTAGAAPTDWNTSYMSTPGAEGGLGVAFDVSGESADGPHRFLMELV